MNSFLRSLLVSSLFLPATSLAANSFGITDFQHSVTLADANKRFRSVDLPAEVLYTLQRIDMGDLRVFDDRGQAMPILILRKNAESVEQNKTLSFYPIPAKQQSDGQIPGVEVERNAQGDVIRILPRLQGQIQDQQTRVNHYLIENREPEDELKRLVLDWSQARHGQASLRIDHSDNLVDWRPLVSKAVLARLQHKDKQLEQNAIVLPGGHSRFLRIGILEADQDFSIQGVSGHFRRSSAPKQNWLPLGGLARTDPVESGIYEFKINSAIRPEKIQLLGPDKAEYYLSGKLYSRPDQQSVWRLRMRQFVQYAVKQGDQWFNSDALSLPDLVDAFYRLELNGGQDLAGIEKLNIHLLMPSYEVVFIAAGPEPFTLAWGNAKIEPDNYAMESLFEQFKQKADDLERVVLEQDLRLENMEQPQVVVVTNWKPIILWSVLVLGVLLAGVMAYQLKKELAAKGSGEVSP